MPTPEGLFYKEFDTGIIDAEKVSRDSNQQPFRDEIGPQATTSKKPESEELNKTLSAVHSKISGRSLSETATRDTVIWGGKFESDVYGSRDIKGSRHGNPVIKRIPYAPGGIGISGLLDNVAVGYIDMVSEHLREHGLPTEHPTGTYELNEIFLEGKRVGIDEWKNWALDEFISRDPANTEAIKKVTEYLERSKFYVIERELQTAERLRDLATCKNEEDFRKVLTPALRWVNAATAAKENGIIPGTSKPQKFEIDDEEDIRKYLGAWIPKQMGTYLGRFCKLGFVNHFPHAQNWSCAGTMYDLDSVTGEAFGQTPTNKDIHNDVSVTMGALEELLHPEGGNYISEHFPGLLIVAKANFIKFYGREKGAQGRPNYKYFMDNSYYDGWETHKRYITPEEWEEILVLNGYSASEKDKSDFQELYLQVTSSNT